MIMNKSIATITDWLDQNGDPEIERFVTKNLAIVEQVREVLENRGWSQADLAKAMDKRPSEVSKWLSGTHNLTIKSIVKMEITLGIDLLHLETQKGTYHKVHNNIQG